MIDFSSLPKKNKAYAGANGSKISVVYNGEQYMLKFPPLPSKNKDMSYTNGCISEYIGSHIFNSAGINAQETLLGYYTVRGKQKVVVACRDFTSVGIVLQDFASLKNQIIDSERNGYGTELNDILRTFHEQTAFDSVAITAFFWDIFIVDALIGNWDRHNGNWGFLYDTRTDRLSFAPIYDCGSSLFPQADDEIMQRVLNDKNELNLRIFNIPLSSIQKGGRKINYFDFLTSLNNTECNEALKRICPRIDMNRINKLIDDIPVISELQKTFYKTLLKARKEHILDYSYNLLMSKEKETTRPSVSKRLKELSAEESASKPQKAKGRNDPQI